MVIKNEKSFILSRDEMSCHLKVRWMAFKDEENAQLLDVLLK